MIQRATAIRAIEQFSYASTAHSFACLRHYSFKFETKNSKRKNEEKQTYCALDIQHYKMLSKYLTCLGINSYQSNQVNNAILITILASNVTIFGPVMIQLFYAMREMDLDGIIEDLPLLVTGVVGIMKVLNIQLNQARFRNLLDSVAKGWKVLDAKNGLLVLEKFTEQGSQLAALYRRTLLTFLVIFLLTPLLNPTLDIIVPLNETRVRHHIFKVNYVFLDEQEYFYAVYVHLSIFSALIVFMIVTVDSLYIVIIHHAGGLFAVCGYQVQQATENNSVQKDGTVSNNGGFVEFQGCVMMHQKAILFHDTLDRCCRNLYLIEMGLNIVVITLTAVEVVMYLHKPEELIRVTVFLVAQYFHLYVISLPGQVLLDQSIELSDKIYESKWYRMSVNIQRGLYTMQMRCSKPCILTAGGLYEMKIESFGMTVKTCMSYITMFLSLME